MVERVKLFSLRKRSPLLPTESVEEYERDCCKIENALEPRDAIEQIFFEDFVYERLQMLRLQRWSSATLNTALTEAVYTILRHLDEFETKDVDLVARWCTDPAARAAVSDRLAKHGLDDSAIEAEAFRRCSPDLGTIHQSLTSHASRRDKGLQFMGFYRGMKARQLQHTAKNIVEGEGARIEPLSPTQQGKNGHRTATRS
jgi:hypothetical protein